MTLKTSHVTRDPRSLKRLPVNARVMTKEMYDRLVANIREDGTLTSWPLVWREPEAPEGDELILSGNHRVDAAQDAGLAEIDCILLDAPDLTRARRLALQLSHNSIAGVDDLATLKLLYDEIDDIDWRQYAGLDDRTLELLDEIDLEPLSEANLDYQTVQVLFLPPELERAKVAIETAANWQADERWAAALSQHERFLDALELARDAYGIGNTAAAIGIILDVFGAHLTDLQAGWLPGATDGSGATRYVPVESVMGGKRMPAGIAAVITQAIDRVIANGDAKHPWTALEAICADYLAGL